MMINFAEYIKSVRRLVGANQSVFAQIVWPEKDPKTTQPLISRYESGESEPSGANLLRIQQVEKEYQKKQVA